jgi:hypothetical protein
MTRPQNSDNRLAKFIKRRVRNLQDLPGSQRSRLSFCCTQKSAPVRKSAFILLQRPPMIVLELEGLFGLGGNPMSVIHKLQNFPFITLPVRRQSGEIAE